MNPPVPPLLFVNGREPTSAELAYAALVNYGHYTTMQVRGGAAQGLDFHFLRLRRQHRELFSAELDTDDVRRHLRSAISIQPDASVRVTVLEPEPEDFRVLTAVRPPQEPSTRPVALRPVSYVRPLAHIKHVGSFGQVFHARQARLAGFDDALLVTPEGNVAETTVANIGFIDDTGVTWPDAPQLRGTTWALLDRHRFGDLRFRHQIVPIDSCSDFRGAFLANSTGVVPIARIGEESYGEGASAMIERLAETCRAAPWERI